MVRLQYLHLALAAPAPRDFHRLLSTLVASSALRSTDVFWPASLPEWLGLRLLGLYRVRRTSRSEVTPDWGGLWLAPPLGPRCYAAARGGGRVTWAGQCLMDALWAGSGWRAGDQGRGIIPTQRHSTACPRGLP